MNPLAKASADKKARAEVADLSNVSPLTDPAKQKIFVLDTNVLLHDPLAIHAFNEHKIVIPMTVLEELDQIKDRHEKDVSREARIAINAIDKIMANASAQAISNGVSIPQAAIEPDATPGTLSIYQDQLITESIDIPYLATNTGHDNDNRIINVALKLQNQHPETPVTLVTKDINMRLKAKGSGLELVEDYRKDKVLDDIDLLARGYQHFDGSFWAGIETVQSHNEGALTIHVLDSETIPHAHINMFVVDDEGFVGHVRDITASEIHLVDLSRDHLMHQSAWGLRPRNLEQAMALYLLQQDFIDITVMTGPAGSGKTLLALANGLQAILEDKRYIKVIVARSTPPLAEDVGFLPGTEEEKMAPWLAAFDDNLEVLHGCDESPFGSVEYVKERANIQFKSLNFMRGRSFNNAYIILDEAQGLTQFQLKSIITRVGTNSKIVVLGNLAQIDNKYITPLTSGLTYLVEGFKGFEHAGLMHVNGIERSRLAAFAEENL